MNSSNCKFVTNLLCEFAPHLYQFAPKSLNSSLYFFGRQGLIPDTQIIQTLTKQFSHCYQYERNFSLNSVKWLASWAPKSTKCLPKESLCKAVELFGSTWNSKRRRNNYFFKIVANKRSKLWQTCQIKTGVIKGLCITCVFVVLF